ncbi:hypothetical protein ACTQ49_06205 [Luteococcus sp. Sow4_B9]|uniref:hypothetical protein n=1 Tax=Luteococcus sp. Sow4_B9 TaxID=3438792 RepID=UPI003F990938
MADPTILRLHALAINAKEPLLVHLDREPHHLEAGDPAVVHDLEVSPGRHELEVIGRVPTGRTGLAAAAIEVPEGSTVDVHYALPAVARMRGEISDEPDVVPGREWRIAIPAVLGLLAVVWGTWFAWMIFG